MHTTGNFVADVFYAAPPKIGLTTTAATDGGTVTVIYATPVTVSDQSPYCGNCGTRRDYVTRRPVDLPVVGFPTRLHIRVPRFTCTNDTGDRRTFQASLACADDGARLARRVIRWILQCLTVAADKRVGDREPLGLGRELVNRISVDAVRGFIYSDRAHLDGVQVLGVDTHVWKHTTEPVCRPQWLRNWWI